MFRIGRDNIIINFEDSKEYDTNILCYEVDCRCHIKRQVNLGRNEDDVINELVKDYINTIKNTIKKYKNIAIIPPVEQEYEFLNCPITHEFPFVGSDSDRVRFTQKMNDLLKKYCYENSFIFLIHLNIYWSRNMYRLETKNLNLIFNF